MTIGIEQPGLFTTVQDLGRPGLQHAGVTPGGAMDAFALRAANLLVGNPDSAAGLEITLTGPELVFHEAATIAITGADLGVTLEGRTPPPWRAVGVPRGARLRFGAARRGCRAYVAIAGGIDVPAVLGGRGTHVRAAFGGLAGRALERGDVLPVGTRSPLAERIARTLLATDRDVRIAPWGLGHSLVASRAAGLVRMIPGPDFPQLGKESLDALREEPFTLASNSDRMGLRFEGRALHLARHEEQLSAPVAFGTIQLPPDGHPIVLMADRQTTGGYPRLGEVVTVDLGVLAQARPGDEVRFQDISLTDAQRLDRERERDLRQARREIELRHQTDR